MIRTCRSVRCGSTISSSRGHRQIAFAYTGIAKWRALGDYWFEGVARAAQLRDLPPVRVGDITLDDAADVVTGWVRDGVTAVCAQSDEIACLVLYGMHQAGLSLPRRPRRDRRRRQPHGCDEHATADARWSSTRVRSPMLRSPPSSSGWGSQRHRLRRADRRRPPDRALVDLRQSVVAWTIRWLSA